MAATIKEPEYVVFQTVDDVESVSDQPVQKSARREEEVCVTVHKYFQKRWQSPLTYRGIYCLSVIESKQKDSSM